MSVHELRLIVTKLLILLSPHTCVSCFTYNTHIHSAIQPMSHGRDYHTRIKVL